MNFYESTNGPAWKKQTNWMNMNEPVKNWHGIHCHSDGSVAKIKLSGVEMRGRLVGLGVIVMMLSIGGVVCVRIFT